MATTYSVGLKFTASGVEQQLRKLQGSTSKLDQAVKKTQGSFDGAANNIQKTGRAAQTASGGINKLSGSLKGLVVQLGLVATAQKALQAGIGRVESDRRIQFLARGYGEAAQLATAASAASKKFGESQTEANKALADIYARLRPVGVSLKDIVSVYNGFNTAARISGASAVEASNAFTQLAQGLGSGALRGDEFNSIAEQVPGILTAISKETGVAQGKLREYAADGKITSDVVIRALKRIEQEGAGQLQEALDGPAQKLKDFQNASEDLGVALSTTLLPALTPIVTETTELVKTIAALPKPVLDAIGQVVLFTAKVWLLHKAITAMIALRAGIVGMLGATATQAAAAGTASATAAGQVAALSARLKTLAALGIVTVGVKFLWEGLNAGQRQEDLLKQRENGDWNNPLAGMPYEAAMAARLKAEKDLTAALAKREKVLEKLKGLSGGGLSTVYGVATGRIGVLNAELNELNLVIEKNQKILSSRVAPKPKEEAIPDPRIPDPENKQIKSLSRGGQIAQALKGPLGLSDAQAAGIVGNLMRESGLNPRINEGGAVGLPRGVGGYGLAQWTGSRQDDLIRFAGGGQAAGDLETQLRFIVHELLGPERRALESLRGARTPEEAAVVFDRDYERSGIKALGERKAGARNVFSELTGGGVGAGLGEYGSLLQDQLDAEQRIAEEKKRQEELLQEQLGTSQQLKAASEDQLYVTQSQGRIQELSRQLAADELQIHEKFAPLIKGALSDEEKSNLLAAQRNELLQTRLQYEKNISSLAQEAGFNMGSALAGMMDQNKELTTSQELLKGSYEIISGSLTSSIRGLIDGTKEWNDVLSDVLGQLGSLFLNTAFKSLGSGIGIPGFDGGGYTGDGPRAGGVDGKGGFPAILHPQEQVIDFTASRSAVAESSSSSSAAFDENAMLLTSSNQMTRERVLERERIQAMNSNPIEVRAESTVINQVEYVTVDQLAASNRQTAREAQARMLSDLKNRPATRAQVGLR